MVAYLMDMMNWFTGGDVTASWRLRQRRHLLRVHGALLVALLLLAGGSLKVGAVDLSWRQIVAFGTMRLSESPSLQLLAEFRWARLQTAFWAGLSFGVAGCLMQTVTHNRLATPDVVGVSDGAGVMIFMGLIVGADMLLGQWWLGVLGALLTVLLILMCARGIGAHGQRFVLVGIGVTALLRAVLELLLSQQELSHATALYLWTLGSLSSRSENLLPLMIGCVVLIPFAMVLQRALTILSLDRDVAISLGLHVRSLNALALCLAMLLAGLAVGVCGPIVFVALAAPVLAQLSLNRARSVNVLASGLIGAMIVIGADTIGRVIYPTQELPAGVICNVLAGVFILWLLWRKPSST